MKFYVVQAIISDKCLRDGHAPVQVSYAVRWQLLFSYVPAFSEGVDS